MAFGENIKALRKQNHLTQRELGEIVGVSDKAVSTWEVGTKVPRLSVIQRLAAYFGVRPSQLTDDGPQPPAEGFAAMLEKLFAVWNRTPEQVESDMGLSHGRMMALRRGEAPPTADELAEFVRYFHVPLSVLLQQPLPAAEPSNIRPLPLSKAPRRRVPVLGRVPAGVPIEAISEVVDELELDSGLSRDGHDYFGLLVTGDSMFPEYRNGDVVILRVQPTAETGDDVVAYIGGSDATLKRIAVNSNGIELRPLNPAYPVRAFTVAEVEALPVTIAGVVVEQRRRFRR